MSQGDQHQFGWVGQFLSFEAGEKSPQQYLAMRVAATDKGSLSAEAMHQVKMGSSLRRMMLGYLEPQDWIRVIGKEKVDSATGQTRWKAREVVKISVQQAMQYAQTVNKDTSKQRNKPEQATDQTRILICQKSSCRQRGAMRVEQAIAQTIANHSCSQRITLVPTGCMKQCKTGPHLVVIPPKQLKAAAKNLRYTHVSPQSVSQIVENLL